MNHSDGQSPPANFDRLAGIYRWLEYLSFGPLLSRCRLEFLPRLTRARRVLVLGDGDGRFVEQLMRSNRRASIDAVDASEAMLARLKRRIERVATPPSTIQTKPATARDPATPTPAAMLRNQITLYQCDALRFEPQWSRTAATHPGDRQPGYDLVVSHFFLDCFSTAEVDTIVGRIRPHLAPNAFWVLSEFAVPETRLAGWLGRVLIAALYSLFGLLTGLRARSLPEHGLALERSGFHLLDRRSRLRGVLVSELWQLRSR